MSGLEKLKLRLGRLSDLGSLGALANWDQQTKMPPDGGEDRAEMLSTLTGITHEMFIDDETGRLLADAADELSREGDGDPDSDDARLLVLVGRQYEKARRVPSELASEMAGAFSVSHEAWVSARSDDDYAAFEPHLRRNLELTRSYVDCHLGSDGYETAYDVLLDDYEPQMRTAEVARLFAELSDELVPVIAAVAEAPPVDDRPVHVPIPVAGQRELVDGVISLMGFSPSSWRLDDTVHPFAQRISHGDTRVTTRWEEDWWPMALFGAMHETGHGLYESGVGDSMRRSPLAAVESLGLHESQSRLWENMVGRGRAFAEVLAPRMRAVAGGGELAGIEPAALFTAVNRVSPSLIRIEADEATYALHIILRFELEQAMIDGTLDVADAAQAWRDRFTELFGLEVPDDADGILQDVHWSAGLIGYFPTYALGNLIAGRLWELAHEQIPGLDEKIAVGELAPLREWLRMRVHRHGAKFTMSELLEREVGGPITVAPFMRYLKSKLSDVYSIQFS